MEKNLKDTISTCDSTDEIYECVIKTIHEIEDMEDCIEATRKLYELLDNMHPSDAYIMFRDHITSFKKNRIINECRIKDVKLYQQIQNLKLEALQSYKHDNACPTNLEVDQAITKAYGITLRALRTNIDLEQKRFDKICLAINKIEEHLKLKVTDFNEDGGTENDTAEPKNEQGYQKDIN